MDLDFYTQLRSVAPLNTPFHIKLSLAVQTTSAIRTISPYSVFNGPRLSAAAKLIAPKSTRWGEDAREKEDAGGAGWRARIVRAGMGQANHPRACFFFLCCGTAADLKIIGEVASAGLVDEDPNIAK